VENKTQRQKWTTKVCIHQVCTTYDHHGQHGVQDGFTKARKCTKSVRRRVLGSKRGKVGEEGGGQVEGRDGSDT